MADKDLIVDLQDDQSEGNKFFLNLLDPVLWNIFFEGFRRGEYGEEDFAKFFEGDL